MDNKPTRQGEMVMRETENRMLDDGIESGGGGGASSEETTALGSE